MEEPGGLRTVWVEGIDPSTGEVGKVPVLVGKRIRLREQYLLLFQETVYKLTIDRRMTGERLRVFNMLVCKCDWENWLYVRHKDLAEDAQMHPSQVSRAVRFLLKVGVVIRGPSLGRAHAYKLNSHYVYKGKVVNLAQHRRREAQRG